MAGRGKTTYIRWAEEQNRLLDDDAGSDSSSGPMVAETFATLPHQRGLPGSPRRNGMVLDAHVQSLFGMRSAPGSGSVGSHSQSLEIYRDSKKTPEHSARSFSDQRHGLLSPSLSGLSLQSAGSGTSWQSPSSGSSRKHSLDAPFECSPQTKRRLRAEKAAAVASYRYSAPSAQLNFGNGHDEQRRRGHLRRSGVPIQYLPLAPNNNVAPPPTARYSALEAEDREEAGGTTASRALLEPFCPVPQSSQTSDTTFPSAERRRSSQDKKLFSFWRSTSPRAEEVATPELYRERHEAAGSARTARVSTIWPASLARARPGKEAQRVVSAETDMEEGGAKIDALDAMDGDEDDNTKSREHATEEAPLTMCGQRLYSEWTGLWDGVHLRVPGAGALFPEGYMPRAGSAEPWICPLWDCQTVFADAWALGGHFSACHRARLLNDNLDGTMSVIGKREAPDSSSGRMPPVVVSRSPLDATTAAPKASPRRPGRRKKSDGRHDEGKARQVTMTAEANSSSAPSLVPAEAPVSRDKQVGPSPPGAGAELTAEAAGLTVGEELGSTVLWQYLMVYLPHDTYLPKDALVRELLPLPRHRELPHRWMFQLAGGHPTTKTLCAVLVYLSGKENVPSCDTCADACAAEGTEASTAAPIFPFTRCVGVPAGASTELREYFGGGVCCNRFCLPVANVNQMHCVSHFSLSSSDLSGALSVLERDVDQVETANDSTTPDADEGGETSDSSGSVTSISFSPSTTHNSPRYRTALRARVAGKPTMVSIRKTAPRTGAVKSKRQSSIRRFAARFGAKAARREVAVYKPSEDVLEEEEEDSVRADIQSTSGDERSGRRMSRRLLEQQQQQTGSSRGGTTGGADTKPFRGGNSPVKTSKLRKRGARIASASPTSSNTGRAASAASVRTDTATTAETGSVAVMTVDWEIAPGRILTGTAENLGGVAFSSSYLTHTGPVSVENDITFQVVVIDPGSNLPLPAEDTKTRLCSVARGTVRVKVPGREFPIGPNGMWTVRQGSPSVVTNLSTEVAVIHVTSIGADGC